MNGCHPYNLSSTKRHSSTAADSPSFSHASHSNASLVNAPPFTHMHPVAAEEAEKAPQSRSIRRPDSVLSKTRMAEGNARRSRTPRGTTRRGATVTQGDRHAELNQAPPPAAITTCRIPASAAAAGDPLVNTRRHSAAAQSPLSQQASTASAKPGTQARLSTLPNNRAPPAAAVASRLSRSKSCGPRVSEIRLRTSVGSRLSDVARSSELYTPTPSSVAADAHRGAVASSQPTLPASSPAVAMEWAPQESRGATLHALATPRASLQNVDDMTRLTPLRVTSRTERTGGAGAVNAPHTPRETWGGAPTLLQPTYERAKSEGMSQSRLSGATFTYANGERSPVVVKPAASQRADALLRCPSRGIASPKELRRRAASVGAARHHTAGLELSLTKLRQPSRRTSSPALMSREPHLCTQPAEGDAAETAEAAVACAQDSSLAVSAPSLLDESEPAVRVSNDFLSHVFLAVDEVRAMDSEPSFLNGSAPNVAGGATPRSGVQRGASTPRVYSPYPEAISFNASPVGRALKGKTETNASTTPRLSGSTPRFTVATKANSVSYTARVSREGTPITGSLSLSALGVPPVAAPTGEAMTCTAAEGDVQHSAVSPSPQHQQQQRSPTARTAPPRDSVAVVSTVDVKRDSQDYVAAVAEQVSRHYYVILTALDIGRGAALQAEPPVALCLRSMVVDLNTVASLLSYDSRNGIQDMLFDDCAFSTMDFTWLSRLRHLSALRFKGPRTTTSMVNHLLSYAPTVQTLTLINTSRITSLAGVAAPTSRVDTLQVIQTDFTKAAYENMVNSPVLRYVMLLQVQLRINIFDLLNTNHLLELHLVGCPNIYYEGLPATEWVSACSPRLEALAMPPEPQKSEKKRSPTRRGRAGHGRGSARKLRKQPRQQEQEREQRPPPPVFPLRALVIADCSGLQLSKVPFADFHQLEEVSVMYQRGVCAADIAGVLEQGKLTTLRLQEVFVDDSLVQHLLKCKNLQELNLSFCRGMRGMETVWPALVESLRVLNVSYSDIDDDGLAGLSECRLLCNVYARGCARLRSFDPIRRLSGSVCVIDLTDCAGLENDAFSEPFNCTGALRLVLAGCSKVATAAGIRSLRTLEELSLANTSVDDNTFAALARDTDAVVLQRLTRLDLSGCRYIGDLTDFAAATTTTTAALRNLVSLNLSRSSVADAGVAHVARAVESGGGCLADLDLSGCTGVQQLGPLGAVKSLRTLNVSCSAVDDDGLAAFVQTSVDAFNRELRVLNLSRCTSITNVRCLGQLSRLVVLNLSGTTVDGPASFAGLASCVGLQELDVSECMHLTSVVELVPRLTNLLSLNLSLTGVGDDSVEAIGDSLTNLEVLQLSGCPRVTRVAALGRLLLLQRLNLSATRVADVAPLASCPQLWDLSVCSCTALTSLQPLAYARMLQRLDASNTPITSASFQDEWTCVALEELDVHGCAELRGVAPGALRKLVSLRRVNACNSGFDNTAVAALAQCENLCDLQLDACPITSLSLLGAVPTLQSIVAQSTAVSDAGLAGLEVSKSLSTLDLSGCGELRDVSILRTMRNLTTLTLRDSGVTDASFAAAWDQSGVRELDVSACTGIRKPALLHTLPDLEVLCAASSGLTDAGLRTVAQCPALRRLIVSDCEQLTDLSPLSTLDGLTHLDASNTPVATLAPREEEAVEKRKEAEDDTPAAETAETAASKEAAPTSTTPVAGWSESSHLRQVVLRGCPAITDVSALRCLGELRSIDLTDSGVSAVGFEHSWQRCASLEEVVLTNCASLAHVRGLWSAPHLMQVHLDRTAVDSLAGAETCASLEVLEVSECRCLKSIANVRGLPRLQQLQCRSSNIIDESFAESWTAPNLLEVNLSGCLQLRDVGALGGLPRLRSVNFAETYIIDGAVRDLSRAPMLEDLDLRGCSRLAHLGSLFRMPRIRALYLSRTCIDNFTFTSVSRCKKLELLEMEDCPYVTNVFVMFQFGQLRFLKFPPLSRMVGSVLQTCHNLEFLSLRRCPESFEIESLSILPRLRVLDLSESEIKKNVLAALNDCQSLEEVDFSYCSQLTSFDAMGRLPRLRCFLAAGLPVTDDVCVKLTEYPLLEKIVLAECHLLRDVSALQALPQLHHLDISESGACEASLVGIRRMRALEELSVHGCKAIHSCHLLTVAPEGSDEAAAASPPVCLPRLCLVDLSSTGITAADDAADIAALRRQCPLLTKVYLSGSRANSAVPSAVANVWKMLTGR